MTAVNELARSLKVTLGKNRTLVITLTVLVLVFLLAISSMSPGDWSITLLRALSVGAVTFLVAAGLSLIFGLLDVLNLAHGTLFMIGAYVGWTVYVRPDTAMDVSPPIVVLAAGLLLKPVWDMLLGRLPALPARVARLWPWIALILALAIMALAFTHYPIAIWNAEVYDQSPVVYAAALEQGQMIIPKPVQYNAESLLVGLGGVLLGGALLAAGLAGFARRQQGGGPTGARLAWRSLAAPLALILVGLGLYLFNTPLTTWLFSLSTTARFLPAIVVATLVGAALGGLMEVSLIRPLYARPMYQLMLTLGLGVVGREIVIAIWGRTQIIMTKPALFNGSGKGCPAVGLGDWLANQCATLSFMGGRARTYNEIFVILVGVVVLVAVGVLLQRTRLGMVIRAGVQDREMVEALGINVRQVFTLVFALGVALATLGGVIAGPSTGVSDGMGESLLLMALIALAIGGLTSFPGAAAGSVLVGLLQQFIIKYGQIGINLPFLDKPFKPTPPLVPASTVLLMVIVLLIMPNGLFGRKE